MTRSAPASDTKTSLPAPFDDALGELRKAMLAWYHAHRRDLPWRRESDPYRIWLSEVMLQQTRVDTVDARYSEWLERFPTLEALAAADPEEVLKAWEGLGYYARARNFHRAAREVGERYQGRVPPEREAFLSLPGVGRYTAGAVLSIAFGFPEPVVDGNVKRVFARWMDDAAPAEAVLWKCAEALVESGGGAEPGSLNQSLMELGATVCMPRSPRCGQCPAAKWCLARRNGTQEECPAPRRARRVPVRRFATIAVGREDRWLVRQRPEEGLLGGMWEFPACALGEGEHAVGQVAREWLYSHAGITVTDPVPLATFSHAFSHFKAEYHAVRAAAESGAATPPANYVWASAEDLEDLALPRAQRRIADCLPK